jgi:peptide/nickel transport system permease protein
MTAFLGRRLLQTVVTLFMVTLISFTLSMILPGDPTLALVGPDGASKEMLEVYRKELGLDQPVVVQYLKWLARMGRGDLGVSIRTRAAVTTLFGQRLPVTLELLVLGMLCAILVAFPLGIIASLRPNTWIDSTSTVLAVSGVAMPPFLLAMLLILCFSLWTGWFPSAGYVEPWKDLWGSLRSLTLPALALGFGVAAETMRQVRSDMLEVLHDEYVRTARAKGLAESVVIVKHALRNALIPVVTLLGLRIGRLVGGLVIIEVIFSLPGIGQMLLSAVLFKDMPVLQSGVLLVALAVTIMNLLVDISYSIIDPRIRCA